jgi:TonB-dependent receptor
MARKPKWIRSLARSVSCAIGLVIIVSARGSAQQSATVSGRVTGPDGQPVPGAEVRIVGSSAHAVTDAAGRYRIVGAPAGQRRLIVTYLGMFADTADVAASGARSVDVTMRVAPVMLNGLAVVGERAGQIRSINQQRNAGTIVNVVSADEIGQLPDQNVAEAVQRLSAAYVQTDRGEGRYVSLRGTAPRLNVVTLNGQPLASPGDGRAVPLDLLPADLVSSVEVTKAVTPDMDGNAVGGVININTLTAFDRAEPFVSVALEGMMHGQQVRYLDDKQPYEGSVTVGRRFGREQTWGFVLGGNVSRRDFGASILDPDGWDDFDGVILPSEIEMQVEDNERSRYGVTSSLDWRPTTRTALGLRALYTYTREVTSNSESELTFEEDPVMLSPTLAHFPAGSSEMDLSQGDERRSLFTLSLHGSQQLARTLTLDVTGTMTRGVLKSTSPDATFESPSDMEQQLGAQVDISRYYFGVAADREDVLLNPNTYVLRTMNYNTRRNDDDALIGAVNVRWDRPLGGLPVFFKAGGKVQLREKVVDPDQTRYQAGSTITTLEPFYLDPLGRVQGGYTSFTHGDVNRFVTFFNRNRSDATRFAINDFFTRFKSIDRDADSSEDVLAAYLMGNAQLGGLTIIAGARVEHTATESTRQDVVENRNAQTITSVTEATFSNDYTNVLPAVVLKLAAGRNLVLRGAWTNTIGRPDFPELGGVRDVNFRPVRGRTDLFTGTVLEGNPDLQPYETMSLDVSAEYYFTFGGVASAGVFHKHIDNPIYEWDITRRDFAYEGMQFQEIRFAQDRNADEGTIRGVELNYAQPLVFLPRPLDGLGISANVAFIDSEAKVDFRDDDIPFFGQSNRVVNVTPYFQRGPVEVRVAWSYRGEYLDEIGAAPFEDRFMDARSTVDMSGSWKLRNRGVELFAQARNLTNEAEIGYQGVRSRYDVHTLTGRTFSLGARATF